MSGEPFSKQQQLARGERRYTRKVASPKRWQAIMDAKGNVCRICLWIRENPKLAAEYGVTLEECGLPVTYHHTVDRGDGGSDTEAGIIPLGGSGTTGHHGMVTRLHRGACAALRAAMTDEEYSYCVDKLGEGRFERKYPVEYRRPA